MLLEVVPRRESRRFRPTLLLVVLGLRTILREDSYEEENPITWIDQDQM